MPRRETRIDLAELEKLCNLQRADVEMRHSLPSAPNPSYAPEDPKVQRHRGECEGQRQDLDSQAPVPAGGQRQPHRGHLRVEESWEQRFQV
jgi:hypothetical protein